MAVEGVTLEEIPLDQILVDDDLNIRRDVTLSSVRSLAENIKSLGKLLQPVVVVPNDGEQPYLLACGFRRVKAHQILGWKSIMAIIHHAVSRREIQLMNVLENLEREDFTLWEEALAIDALYPGGQPVYRDVAKELEKNSTWVSLRYRLLGMPKQIQKAAHQKLLTEGDVRHLQTIKDPDEQLKEFKQIQRDKRTGRKKKPFVTNKRRSIEEATKAATLMLDSNCIGFGPLAIAYTEGWITAERFQKEVKEQGIHFRKVVEKVEELSKKVEEMRVLLYRGAGDD